MVLPTTQKTKPNDYLNSYCFPLTRLLSVTKDRHAESRFKLEYSTLLYERTVGLFYIVGCVVHQGEEVHVRFFVGMLALVRGE